MAGLMKLIHRKKKKEEGEPKEDHGGPSVLAETIEKIALEVDYHGLADLYEASSWYARLFWSVIVIGALGAVIHDCYNIILLFASNPSATKISEFGVKSLDLPNVTVCNMGAFNQTELRNRLDAAGETDIQRQNEFIRYMMLMAYQTPPSTNGTRTLAPGYEHPSKALWDRMGLAGINETKKFIREVAYQCPKFLIECEFEEEPFDCCESVIFVYTDLGGCYTIRPTNITGPAKQTGRDSLSGIAATTQMDVTEIAILEEWKSVGLRLQFGDYVSPFDFSSMLHLPPGMLAMVRLSPVRYLLDYTVTQCWTIEPKLTYHDGYSTGLCKHDCVLKYTVKTCGCMPYGYSTKHAEQFRTCTIEEMRECVLGRIWNTENGSDPLEVQQCKRSTCLRMCSYWIEEPYLMLSQLKHDPNENTTLRTNVLNVYFGYMRYTQTEAAQLMTFDTFISNLGGAIGLWTGMSLISIVQMAIFAWEGWWRLVERRRAEKLIQTMLAQHPAQGTSGQLDKPIRIKDNMFVKPTVQYGAPQPPGHKGATKSGLDNPGFSGHFIPAKGAPALGPKPPPPYVQPKTSISLVARLKSMFKRGRDHVQPADLPSHSSMAKIEDLPPDPKPRIASPDDQQSLGTLFEPPPNTVQNVGSGAPVPWTTTIDEQDKPKTGPATKLDDTYSHPSSPFTRTASSDSQSWSTAETTTTRMDGSDNESRRTRVPKQHSNAVRRNSRGTVGGGHGRNAGLARKRTQSDHRQKRHPLSRARY